MRICPACRATYEGSATRCAVDSTLLVDDSEQAISLSETISSSSAAMKAAVAPSPAPAPLVRARVTPGPVSGALAEARTGADLLVGARLSDRYEVTRKIGEGGMGAVYEARHSLIGKRVAIKVLLDKYAEKADVVARLQQEARLASSIGHEHIIDITDFGTTDDGRTFVVMEFLDGHALADVLAREGPLPPARAVAIARQVASALGAAHEKGVVHRDIKPENVFITQRAERDFVKVVDFGISKLMRPAEEEAGGAVPSPSSSPRLTQTGMVLGTPLYMSPEQARGEDVLDHRIDVYALGVILYELITGEVPFRGTNYLSIISQVLSQEPKSPGQIRPDLGISPALEAVIMKAMAKDRAVRYQTMAELDADLAKLQSGEAVTAVPSEHLSLGPRGGGIRPGRGGRLAAWIGGVAVLAVAVAFVIPRLMSGRTDGAKADPPAVAPVAQPPPRPPPPPPPDPPKVPKVVAHITSEPEGADIYLGDVFQDKKTPADVEVPGNGEKMEFTLRLDGYDDGRAWFFATEDKPVAVKLKKLKPGARPVRPPRPPPSNGATPPDHGGSGDETMGGSLFDKNKNKDK